MQYSAISPIWLVALLLVLGGACTAVEAPRSPGAIAETHVIVVASFEPAWMERDAWTLEVTSDGSVMGRGHTLGHFRRRISRDAVTDLARSAQALTDKLDPASYTSIVEDADAIRLKVTHEDQVSEYWLEDPQSIDCASRLGTLARLWNLLILSCAPEAICNGSTCLLCDGQKGS